jgi:hypothetical protein
MTQPVVLLCAGLALLLSSCKGPQTHALASSDRQIVQIDDNLWRSGNVVFWVQGVREEIRTQPTPGVRNVEFLLAAKNVGRTNVEIKPTNGWLHPRERLENPDDYNWLILSWHKSSVDGYGRSNLLIKPGQTEYAIALRTGDLPLDKSTQGPWDISVTLNILDEKDLIGTRYTTFLNPGLWISGLTASSSVTR